MTCTTILRKLKHRLLRKRHIIVCMLLLFPLYLAIFRIYCRVRNRKELRRNIKRLPYDDLGRNDARMPNFPPHSDDTSLYPHPSRPWDDRIIKQLSYTPRTTPTTIKTIFTPVSHYGLRGDGQGIFRNLNCKVTQCSLTHDVRDAPHADLVYFQDYAETSQPVWDVLLQHRRRLGQIWAVKNQENQFLTRNVMGDMQYNWSVSYAPWSTVPLVYSKMVPIEPTAKPKADKNYASGKSGKVLWFCSNCRYTFNKRLEYVTELSRHIDVDIYGQCGRNVCTDYMGDCMLDLLADYKFYLSFENANCETYITEKFFQTALTNDIVPVVMGALPAYYTHVAPPNSFIPAEDYPSPAHLAAYLHRVDANHTLYNSYFRWKGSWRTLPSDNLACRLCGLLHAPRRTIITSHKQWVQREHCRKAIYDVSMVSTCFYAVYNFIIRSIDSYL